MDFGATSPAFADAMEALSKAWVVVSKSPEPRLAFDTWQRYLTVTYGQPSTMEKGTDLTFLSGVTDAPLALLHEMQQCSASNGRAIRLLLELAAVAAAAATTLSGAI